MELCCTLRTHTWDSEGCIIGRIIKHSGREAVGINAPVPFAGGLLPAEGSGSGVQLEAHVEKEQL